MITNIQFFWFQYTCSNSFCRVLSIQLSTRIKMTDFIHDQQHRIKAIAPYLVLFCSIHNFLHCSQISGYSSSVYKIWPPKGEIQCASPKHNANEKQRRKTKIKTKTRLTYNCARLRSKVFLVKIFLGENYWGENFWGEIV